jgi:hypothetical protein
VRQTLIMTVSISKTIKTKLLSNENKDEMIPYLGVKKPHFFYKNLPSKIGARLMHGILSFLRVSPRHRYCML